MLIVHAPTQHATVPDWSLLHLSTVHPCERRSRTSKSRKKLALAVVDAWRGMGTQKREEYSCAHGANESGFSTAPKISCRAQKAKTFVDAAAATRWVGAGLDARINI